MDLFVYISSWNNFGGSPGMGLYKFDAELGELSFINMCNTTDAFNATCLDKTRNILYVCNEVNAPKEFNGRGGQIFAYKIGKKGQLTEISVVNTFCPNPAFVSLNADGSRMLVANHSGFSAVSKIQKDAFGKYHLQIVYDDAALELFEILPDGAIGELKDVALHTGSGPRPLQMHARPHCIVRSPSGKLFAVCDKGSDCVYMYTIYRDSLELCDMPFRDVPGSMPRYCVFHPTKPFLYVNHEGSTDLSVFHYTEDGKLTLVGSYHTLTEEYSKDPDRDLCHDEQQGLVISNDGQFIYDMINGPDVVSVFCIDQTTGVPTLIQNQKITGNWLRSGALSPDGRFLITVSLKPGNIEVFHVNDNGTLESENNVLIQSAAAYVTFAELE